MIVVLKSLIKPKQEKVMLTGKCSFEINSNIQGSRKRLEILLIIKLWPYTLLGTSGLANCFTKRGTVQEK